MNLTSEFVAYWIDFRCLQQVAYSPRYTDMPVASNLVRACHLLCLTKTIFTTQVISITQQQIYLWNTCKNILSYVQIQSSPDWRPNPSNHTDRCQLCSEGYSQSCYEPFRPFKVLFIATYWQGHLVHFEETLQPDLYHPPPGRLLHIERAPKHLLDFRCEHVGGKNSKERNRLPTIP